ncbi:sulfatase family protein [Paenibacillus aceris]|uniref:Arylsulfatase A-like enzyme n=1 Tax=Paenibacillus aceris TaxID=869555 RepID=A0ABS4I6K9_9BACL|nr:sulfatase [Paenibacillus aceris]MBP1966562.1 arylsulfatase A-like enzyme [Paenibacillus aceris]NHW39467.1 sulfatase-like hydrolase/transferase [Paenibacillus aceris]
MNIVFISMDTMRASRLGCYGYEKPTSPYMDQIAEQGVLFERAYAADIPTEVAHTGIFTGKVGLRTGVVSHGSPLTQLPKKESWLPSLLQNHGFTTAAVDNLYQLKEWFARGYRYYINSVQKTRSIDGKSVNELAFKWIREHKEDDFFLFLHYWDPHTPYQPPASYVPAFYDKSRDPYDPANRSMHAAYNHAAYPFFKHHHYDLLGPVTDAAYVNALYDAEVRYLDDRLRDLDELLKAEGLYEDTLLILFGDHGESLTEHDIYWDHCGLYEASVQVPMIMRWPGRIPEGRRVKGLVQQVDMMPTILEAAGILTPANIDGRSLWPSIRGESEGTHDAIYLSECAWQASRGVVTKDYKFIRTLDAGPFVRPPRELYDLRVDPDETVNIAESSTAVADELAYQLDEWTEKMLNGRGDPMLTQIEAGLPFRNRIHEILLQYGLTWDEWIQDPRRDRFDEASAARHAGR